MKLRTLLLFLLFITPSFEAYSYSFQVCGTGANQFRPKHINNDLRIAIYERGFSNTELNIIRRSIREWDNNKIGKSGLNISLVNLPVLDKNQMDFIHNQLTGEERFDAKRTFVSELSTVNIVYKETTPGDTSTVGQSWSKRLESGFCSQDNPPSRRWRRGGGIYFNASSNLTTQPWWALGSDSSFSDYNYIAVHEVGHLIGLNHPDNPRNTVAWNNRNYKPTVMMSGFFDRTYGGGTTFERNNGNPRGTRRQALPYGDDREALRNLYPTGSFNYNDLAINHYEYSDRWDNNPFVRYQSLWQSNWYGNPVAFDGLSLGSGGGFSPVTVHNLGSSGKRARGFISLVKMSSAFNQAGTQGGTCYFEAWVPRGQHVQLRCWVRSPSRSAGAGQYAIYTRLHTGLRDSNNPNNGDTTVRRWIID